MARTTKADLEARNAELAAELERCRAAARHDIRVLLGVRHMLRATAAALERAQEDRDTALGRLASCAEECRAFKHQLAEARQALAQLTGAMP